jgi:hypothetical protein
MYNLITLKEKSRTSFKKNVENKHVAPKGEYFNHFNNNKKDFDENLSTDCTKYININLGVYPESHQQSLKML